MFNLTVIGDKREMANRMFQSVILQMKEVITCGFGVVDDCGYIVCCDDPQLTGSRMQDFKDLVFTDDQIVNALGRLFKPIVSDGGRIDYVAYINDTSTESEKFLTLATVAFVENRINYDEKHNKAAFIKNIISDNILPGDVYVRAKELHFVTDDNRIAILVRQNGVPDVAAVEVVSRLYPNKQNDFVINMNESDIVVIKNLGEGEDYGLAVEDAEHIQEVLREELGVETTVGISTIAYHIRELADRYKESQVSIDVGNIFDQDNSIHRYDNLGLGRIIYQLPTTLCEMFLNEVFKKNPLETLDEDTLETINKFFENNLNVSETSRKLYVHRNTLVYRLEKIKKLTGLDLREFDHAIVFKVAMMVRQYVDTLKAGQYITGGGLRK